MTTDIKRNEQGVAVRRLGKTELEVSVMGFGGGHYCRPPNTEADCVSLIRRSIDAGITFMDNAWGYWDGECVCECLLGLELLLGQLCLVLGLRWPVLALAPQFFILLFSSYPQGLLWGLIYGRLRRATCRYPVHGPLARARPRLRRGGYRRLAAGRTVV